MRFVRLAPWGGAALFAAIVFVAPSPAVATCSNPVCTPSADGSGCCNSHCAWKSPGAVCRDEEDPCHEGVCTAEGSDYVCVQPAGGGADARNGKKCADPLNPCLIGECRDGFCSLADGFSEACPDTDGNQCTYQCVVQDGKGVCVPPFNLDFADCFQLQGSACVEGFCYSGSCVLGQTSYPCPLGLDICEKYECRPTDGSCHIVPDPSAVCDDTSPTDCIEKFCTNRGNCRTVNVDRYEPCSPGDNNVCTNDYCDGNGYCSEAFAKPWGTACTTDTNNCTNQTCQYSPTVIPGYAECKVTSCQPSTTQCAVCAVPCANSLPDNTSCGCANQ